MASPVGRHIHSIQMQETGVPTPRFVIADRRQIEPQCIFALQRTVMAATRRVCERAQMRAAARRPGLKTPAASASCQRRVCAERRPESASTTCLRRCGIVVDGGLRRHAEDGAVVTKRSPFSSPAVHRRPMRGVPPARDRFRYNHTTIAARSLAARAHAAAASSSNNSVSFCIIVPPSSSASTMVTARR